MPIDRREMLGGLLGTALGRRTCDTRPGANRCGRHRHPPGAGWTKLADRALPRQAGRHRSSYRALSAGTATARAACTAPPMAATAGPSCSINPALSYARSASSMSGSASSAISAPARFPGVTDTNPLYRTTDGGKSWSPVTRITGPAPSGICAIHVLRQPFVNSGVLDYRVTLPRGRASRRAGASADLERSGAELGFARYDGIDRDDPRCAFRQRTDRFHRRSQ